MQLGLAMRTGVLPAHRTTHLRSLQARQPPRATTGCKAAQGPSEGHPSRRQVLLTTAAGLGAVNSGSGMSVSAAAGVQAQLPAVPTVELAPGLTISRVIKGCWQLSGGHAGDRASDHTSGRSAVEDFQAFVDAGVTTFDTADIYGPSEGLIGKYLAQRGAGAAPPVQVLTKFCCFGDAMRSAASRDFVERGIDGSRGRLGVPRLDLVQFYWHDYGNKNYVAAAQHLAALQADGKILAVGATNFDVARMREMRDAGVKLANHQVQYSLLDRRPENGMVAYCQEEGIGITPYGAVAGGFLTDKYLGVSPDKVKMDTYSKSKYGSVIGKAGGWDWLQALLRTLRGVADKHDSSIANVATRWVLDRPGVSGVIVGARNADHVDDHRRLFSLALDEEDLAAIDAVLAKGPAPEGDCYSWERGGRF